jgi:hypothetical protein
MFQSTISKENSYEKIIREMQDYENETAPLNPILREQGKEIFSLRTYIQTTWVTPRC